MISKVYLQDFITEINKWLEAPSISGPEEPMKNIKSVAELALEFLEKPRQLNQEEEHLLNGGVYLTRYFDGWGEEFLRKYFEIVSCIKNKQRSTG